jgi:hypothetical protein
VAQVAIQGPDPARLSSLPLSPYRPSQPTALKGACCTTGKPEIAKTPEAAGKLGTAGKLDGQIDLTGTGRSLADFLASANGNVFVSRRKWKSRRGGPAKQSSLWRRRRPVASRMRGPPPPVTRNVFPARV